jgi:hypothetical protein
MGSTVLIVLTITAAICISVMALIVRRSSQNERFCVKCEKFTLHQKDYGVGPIMSYIMAFLTLGMQTMTDQYYPFRCKVCGTAYRQKEAEKKFDEKTLGEIREDSESQEVSLDQWTGTGGVQKWDKLKANQRLFLVFAIGLGLALHFICFPELDELIPSFSLI